MQCLPRTFALVHLKVALSASSTTGLDGASLSQAPGITWGKEYKIKALRPHFMLEEPRNTQQSVSHGVPRGILHSYGFEEEFRAC
jgi:hypothetical protein